MYFLFFVGLGSGSSLPNSTLSIYEGLLNSDIKPLTDQGMTISIPLSVKVIDSCFSNGAITILKRSFSDISAAPLFGNSVDLSEVNGPEDQVACFFWEEGMLCSLDNLGEVTEWGQIETIAWEKQRHATKNIQHYTAELWTVPSRKIKVWVAKDAAPSIRPGIFPLPPVKRGAVLEFEDPQTELHLVKSLPVTFDFSPYLRLLEKK